MNVQTDSHIGVKVDKSKATEKHTYLVNPFPDDSLIYQNIKFENNLKREDILESISATSQLKKILNRLLEYLSVNKN